jgi:CRISPR-associated protein Csb1
MLMIGGFGRSRLCAGVLASERGTSLRSRCSLRPIAPRVWELLDLPGEIPAQFSITGEQAMGLLREAVATAKASGLPWMQEKLILKPAPELLDMVRRSQEVAAADGDAEG